MEAEETAAKYNKDLATHAGEIKAAKRYESELARISKERAAADERAAAAFEAERARLDNLELKNRLKKLEDLLREKSCAP